ncbi:MAG: hypothetical protein R3A11_07405 [Bdellovibrionota bacterium]
MRRTRFFLMYVLMLWAIPHLHVAYAQEPSQTTSENLLVSEKVQLLQAFLENQSVDFHRLQSILDPRWFLSDEATQEKSKWSAKLEETPEEKSQERRLATLMMRALDLPLEQRKKKWEDAKSIKFIQETKEQAQKQIDQVQQENKKVEKNKELIAKQINKTNQSDITREVYVEKEKLENAYADLNRYRAMIASQSKQMADRLENWKTKREQFWIAFEKAGLENNGSGQASLWTSTMDQVKQALHESNLRMEDPQFFDPPQPPDQGMILKSFGALELQYPKEMDVIQSYQKRKNDFGNFLSLVVGERKDFIQSAMESEQALRFLLKMFRADLLVDSQGHWRKVEQKADRSPFLYVHTEIHSMYAEIVFSLHKIKYKWTRSQISSQRSPAQWLWQWLKWIRQWSKVLFLILVTYAAFRFQTPLIQGFRNLTQSWFVRSSFSRFLHWCADLLESFYPFFVIGCASFLLISLGTQSGFSELQSLIPYLTLFLQYFLFLGVLEAIVPIISQRKYRSYGQAQAEVLAIESTFRLIPFYLLRLWVVWKVVAIFLTQFFTISWMEQWLGQMAALLALPMLLWGVRRHIENWRQTCRNVSADARWKKWLDASKGKIWEPALLLLGGGFGVYLIAWRRIGKRLIDTQVSKRFQAMVSRAILERSRKQRSTQISFQNLPEGYEEAFGQYSLWKSQWHVGQKEISTSLQDAYIKWKESETGRTILLTGERGIGKSALLDQFCFQSHNDWKRVRIPYGSYQKNKLFSLISKSIFDQEFESEQHLIDHFNELEPQVFIIERLENAVLRTIGGFDAFSFLLNLMLKAKKHFWLCTLNIHTWGFLRHAMADMNCFSHVFHLKGLKEEEIKQLIFSRNEEFDMSLDFSQFSYSEKNSWKPRSWDQKEKEKELYFRILWDFTKGNPREAMYFWTSSLQVSASSAKVALFDVPDSVVLEKISDPALMLLAAIVEHNGLSRENLCSVLRSHEQIVDRLLETLDVHGIVYENARSKTLHLDSFWYRSVSHYLLRRNLLYQGEKV